MSDAEYSSPLLSLLWVQEFSQDDLDVAATPAELEQVLDSIFQSADIGKHAKQWDSTFVDAAVLGSLAQPSPCKTQVAHWQFAAAPLAGRDMLYAITKLQRMGRGAGEQQTTYAYSSVSDEWVESNLGVKPKATGRVRALNMFPSCDRVTISSDGKLRVEHLMTTSVGGWVGPFCYNNCFKSALIDANAHEAQAMREYVLRLLGRAGTDEKTSTDGKRGH